MNISIIGIGRLGGALALALDAENYTIENLFAHNISNAETIAEQMKSQPRILTDADFAVIDSDAVLIATQDFAISATAAKLAKQLENKPAILHTSGSLSSDVLAELREINCPVGSLHPLISISSAMLGKSGFRHAYFCVEGDPAAVTTAEKLAADLGGKSFSIRPEMKTLYHAAAVTACGHLVALFDIALEMMNKSGIETTQANEILLPLVKSTVENLATQTTAAALTGTFARGDAETFRRHLDSLRENVSDEILEIYLLLAVRSTQIAESANAGDEKYRKLLSEILLAKKNRRC